MDRSPHIARVVVARNGSIPPCPHLSNQPFYALTSYCSSLTFSIQSAAFPFSCSWMAICVMAVVGDAPCQCFSPARTKRYHRDEFLPQARPNAGPDRNLRSRSGFSPWGGYAKPSGRPAQRSRFRAIRDPCQFKAYERGCRMRFPNSSYLLPVPLECHPFGHCCPVFAARWAGRNLGLNPGQSGAVTAKQVAGTNRTDRPIRGLQQRKVFARPAQ
jgi:hypothetical protein